MQIKRDELNNTLKEFALNGNGIVIGAPGVGKTFLLKSLCSNLMNNKVKCLYLPVDKLSFERESELREELNIKTNFIEYLKKQKSDNKRGLIIIDGFDAARSEGVRDFYLNLIRKLIKKLDDSWNILVSVRIYDAQKSGDLMDLFPKNNFHVQHHYQMIDINCRHFFVPELKEREIEESLKDMPYILDIYKRGSSDFKKILKTPFNIWLLEKLVEYRSDLSQLSSITSEIQLLGLFWKYRVTDGNLGNTKEILLSRITRKMVETSSLSIRKDKIYYGDDEKAWNSLLSSEILINVTSTGQKVSFSHNILFDYAVSMLLIDDNYEHMIDFINTDLSRPLFLRPSLNYYFTRLWYFEPTIFWENFWNLFTSDDPNLHLFSRLLPIKTIVEETKNIEEINPLFSSSKDLLQSNSAISRIIQALIALEIKNDDLWVKFLKKSAKRISDEFAFDLAKITEIILNRAQNINDNNIVKYCGSISRLLLEWVWNSRMNDNSGRINFIGRLTIPLVVKTYRTDAKRSRELLRQVLEVLNEENFPINLVYILTAELNNVWPIDPEFAAEVYKSVFRYQEKSESKTPMGTPVLPMSSTRRQDYEMCHFHLINHFPNFIKDSPLIAIQAGIKSLNNYIIEREVIVYLKDKNELNEIIEKFKFRGKDVEYIPDGSYIWDDNFTRYEPLKIGNEIFKFISELEVDDPIFSSLLDVFAENARVAFFWKRLLEIGSEKPTFANQLYELCLAIPIQLGLETVHALTKFIESASEEFENENLFKIEESILNIPHIESRLEMDYLKDRRDRYLSRIPFNLLKDDKSIKIMEKIKETGKIPDNRPPVKFGEITSEIYTEEKMYKDSGIDIEKSENQKLYMFFSKMDKFTSEFQNEIPNKKQIISLLPLAKELYNVLNEDNDADEQVSNSAWTKLASYCEIVSRSDNDPESDEFKFCREVLLVCAKHSYPKPNPEFDLRYHSPAWSPAPRNEAAIGLSWLAIYNADEEILNTLQNLISDEVPSVRYLAVRQLSRLSINEPDIFWKLAEQIAKSEKNIVVQNALLNNLNQVLNENETKTVDVLKIFTNKISLEEDSTVLNSFAFIIMKLLFMKNNEWAEGISNGILYDPIKKSKILNHATFYALQYLNPEHYSSQNNNESEKAIKWLINVVNIVGTLIDELQKLQLDDMREVNSKIGEMYQIIDEIVTRIYFAADVRDGGKKLSDSQRRDFYLDIKPLLERIVLIQSQNGFMVSGTAYYFLEFLNGVLKYDPEGSLHMASGVVKAAKSTGFSLDHLALGEVTNLVEVLLADHRKKIRNEESLRDLISILDIFADAGWSEAINLFWHLDEIFR